MKTLTSILVIGTLSIIAPAQEPAKADDAPKDALANLKLPGVKVNLEERAIDVTSTVCITGNSLEFVACTPNTKEHESIIAVNAKPSHIHVALLLLGIKPGHPAISKGLGEGANFRWIDIPPQGNPVAISFVTTDAAGKQTERPVSDFVTRVDADGEPEPGEAAKRLKTFLFAGSHLHPKGEGAKTYLADKSGSVISLSTFGDELLCLPGVFGHANHALPWELNSKHLPKVGTKIILRLRPQAKVEIPKR